MHYDDFDSPTQTFRFDIDWLILSSLLFSFSFFSFFFLLRGDGGGRGKLGVRDSMGGTARKGRGDGGNFFLRMLPKTCLFSRSLIPLELEFSMK